MKHLTARPDMSMLPQPYQTHRGQGTGQRPQSASQPRIRPVAPRRCAACPRSPDHRRWQGPRSCRGGFDRRQDGGRRHMTTSCGSRPRNRSSTSARILAPAGLRVEMSSESGSGPTGRLCGAPKAISPRPRNQPAPPRPSRANGTVRQAAYARPASQRPTRRVATPAARASSSGQRQGPYRRAGGLDALGGPALALLTVPAAATPGYRSIGRSPASGFSLRHGAPGYVDDDRPQQIDRVPQDRRNQPTPDCSGRRTAGRRGRPCAGTDFTTRTGRSSKRFLIMPAIWLPSISGFCTRSWEAGHRWSLATGRRGFGSCRCWPRRRCRRRSSRFGPTPDKTGSRSPP